MSKLHKGQLQTVSTLDSLFSDDFGGSAVVSSYWDVIDGGFPAITAGQPVTALQDAPIATFNQAKIGSGITGITYSVANSALSVVLPTTNGAELWFLSKQTFAGKEDILAILSKTQAIAANSVFIGIVEVDATTGIPLLNTNLAADGNGSCEFTNKGGCEFGRTTTNTAFQAEAIGDNSGAKALGAVGVAGSAMTTTQEYLIEIDSRDIIISNSAVDSVAPKVTGASRVSSQCPDDRRLYKLVVRFKNVAAAASATTVALQRILVVDNYEQRVQISSGEGDQIGSKAVPVIVTSSASLTVGSGVVTLNPSASGGGPYTFHKLIAAASTNLTSVKNSASVLTGGHLNNVSATVKYFKLYNKALAPVIGTDVPVLTIAIPAGQLVAIADIVGAYGAKFTTGIAYAITGAAADTDTTALTAGDVIVGLIYA